MTSNDTGEGSSVKRAGEATIADWAKTLVVSLTKANHQRGGNRGPKGPWFTVENNKHAI